MNSAYSFGAFVDDQTEAIPQTNFNKYRDYLHVLARMQMGEHVREKFDPSDVVQITLLQACKQPEFADGRSEGEIMAWLRQTLIHCILGAARSLNRAKRDIRQEKSLEHAVEESSVRLERWLACEGSSPSQNAQRHEMILKLTAALKSLPDEQRDVLVLRHCQNLSFAEISVKLGRSERSIAGLLHRGLAKLRAILHDPA